MSGKRWCRSPNCGHKRTPRGAIWRMPDSRRVPLQEPSIPPRGMRAGRVGCSWVTRRTASSECQGRLVRGCVLVAPLATRIRLITTSAIRTSLSEGRPRPATTALAAQCRSARVHSRLPVRRSTNEHHLKTHHYRVTPPTLIGVERLREEPHVQISVVHVGACGSANMITRCSSSPTCDAATTRVRRPQSHHPGTVTPQVRPSRPASSWLIGLMPGDVHREPGAR